MESERVKVSLIDNIVSAPIKVSVIIPVYNAEKYLEQCLDSVCAQTLQEIEIICVNDESSDRSPEILEEYAKRDSRIRLIQNRHIGYGPASARNAGLDAARGKYLSILDADDFFELDMLQLAYERAESVGADIVKYDADIYDDEKKRFISASNILCKKYLPKETVFTSADCKDKLFQMSIGAAWSMLVHRDLIETYRLQFQSLAHTNDLFFTYAALAVGKRIATVDKKLLHYRKNNPKSISSNITKAPLAGIEAWKKLQELLWEQDLYTQYRKSFVAAAAEHCKWCLDEMQDIEAFKCLYSYLRFVGFQELNIGLQADIESKVYSQDLEEWITCVHQYSPEEYLFLQTLQARKVCPDPFLKYSFPQKLFHRTDRIVLYGAGAVGNEYFAENRKNEYCKIVGWVDRNYERYGYPIMPPDALKKMEFDYILIAVEDAKAAESIRADIGNLGIEQQKIYWRNPIFDMTDIERRNADGS